ncbi:hypothetical protein ABIB56_003756 [Glaciihabitans sp. UYNi722]
MNNKLVKGAKFTRFVNRRTVLKGTLATVFGVVAGATVGMPQAAYAAFPCSGLPNCRSTNPILCSGHTCSGNGYNAQCTAAPGMCSGSGNCWTSGGGQCCDCSCSIFSAGGYTFNCICYG